MTEESVTLEQENILGEYHSKVTFVHVTISWNTAKVGVKHQSINQSINQTKAVNNENTHEFLKEQNKCQNFLNCFDHIFSIVFISRFGFILKLYSGVVYCT